MTQRRQSPPRESGGEAPGNQSERSERREPNSRAPAEPAALALRMEDLSLWTAERVAKFPRDHKFTVGDRLLETCLEELPDEPQQRRGFSLEWRVEEAVAQPAELRRGHPIELGPGDGVVDAGKDSARLMRVRVARMSLAVKQPATSVRSHR